MTHEQPYWIESTRQGRYQVDGWQTAYSKAWKCPTATYKTYEEARQAALKTIRAAGLKPRKINF